MNRYFAFFILLFISFHLSNGNAQTLVVRVKNTNSKVAAQTGNPLFPLSSNSKTNYDPMAVSFFGSFLVYDINEILPPVDEILYIDTVMVLKVNREKSRSRTGNLPLENAYVKTAPSDKYIRVGIIDTGIDFEHPLLVDFMHINEAEDINGNGRLDKEDLNGIDEDANGYIDDVSGYDFVNVPEQPDFGDYLDEDPWPEDEFPGGHGTPVAHAAVLGSYGKVSIVNLRAGTALGFLQEDDVARALYYAYLNGVNIINMSFGDIRMSRFLSDLIFFLRDQGMLFVASAGNSANNRYHYPSSLTTVLSVGSVNKNGFRSGFSNFGYFVDCYAPGEGLELAQPGGVTGSFSGTSFAAPMVSGGLAEMWYQNSGISAPQLRTWGLLSAQKKGSGAWTEDLSNGIFLADTIDTFIGSGDIRLVTPDRSEIVSDSILLISETNGLALGELHISALDENDDVWKSISIIDHFGLDSVWYYPSSDSGIIIIRLSWNDPRSGSGISFYSQIVKQHSIPRIKSYQLVSLLDRDMTIYSIFAKLSQSAILFYNSNENQYVATVEDTSVFLNISPLYEEELTGGYFYAKNITGASDTIGVPDLTFRGVLSGNLFENGIDVNIGSGFIWPEKINGNNYAASLYKDNGQLDLLKIYSLNDTSSLYTFDASWIVRDIKFLGEGVYRFLVGFSSNSAIIDYSFASNTVLDQWFFNGQWGVNFYGHKALFRQAAEFILKEKNGEEWTDIFHFDQHPQGTIFSIPAAVYLDKQVLFADFKGTVYVYNLISENQFEYRGSFNLTGEDPGGMIASWHIEIGIDTLNTFWAVSEIRPEILGDTNFASRFWKLEGFLISPDTVRKIGDVNIAGVADRKSKPPALGVVNISQSEIMAMQLFPDSYFWSFKDSLILRHLSSSESQYFNYALHSSSNQYLTAENGGTVKEVSLNSEEDILPMPSDLSWLLPDSNNLSLTWQGNVASAYRIRDLNTGLDTIITGTQFQLATGGLPYKAEISIRQELDGLTSDWTPPREINIPDVPELVEMIFYENDFIVINFDRKMRFVMNMKTFSINEAEISSARNIAAHTYLLRIRPFTGDTLTLSIENLFDTNGAFYQLSDSMLIRERTAWQPFVVSASYDGSALALDLAGSFSDTTLLNRYNYLFLPGEQNPDEVLLSENRIVINTGDLVRYGEDTNLDLSKIKDENGLVLGNPQVWLAGNKITDLSHLAIYPQPLIMSKWNTLIIGGLPMDSEIYIFTPQWILVKKIASTNQNEKIYWNLENEIGQIVASGVYLLLVKNSSDEVLKKIMILR